LLVIRNPVGFRARLWTRLRGSPRGCERSSPRSWMARRTIACAAKALWSASGKFLVLFKRERIGRIYEEKEGDRAREAAQPPRPETEGELCHLLPFPTPLSQAQPCARQSVSRRPRPTPTRTPPVSHVRTGHVARRTAKEATPKTQPPTDSVNSGRPVSQGPLALVTRSRCRRHARPRGITSITGEEGYWKAPDMGARRRARGERGTPRAP
jgi:hypothetical protein